MAEEKKEKKNIIVTRDQYNRLNTYIINDKYKTLENKTEEFGKMFYGVLPVKYMHMANGESGWVVDRGAMRCCHLDEMLISPDEIVSIMSVEWGIF